MPPSDDVASPLRQCSNVSNAGRFVTSVDVVHVQYYTDLPSHVHAPGELRSCLPSRTPACARWQQHDPPSADQLIVTLVTGVSRATQCLGFGPAPTAWLFTLSAHRPWSARFGGLVVRVGAVQPERFAIHVQCEEVDQPDRGWHRSRAAPVFTALLPHALSAHKSDFARCQHSSSRCQAPGSDSGAHLPRLRATTVCPELLPWR